MIADPFVANSVKIACQRR